MIYQGLWHSGGLERAPTHLTCPQVAPISIEMGTGMHFLFLKLCPLRAHMTTIHRWNEHQMLVPSVYGSHMCPQGAKLPTVVKDHHKRDGPSPPSGACPFHGASLDLGWDRSGIKFLGDPTQGHRDYRGWRGGTRWSASWITIVIHEADPA